MENIITDLAKEIIRDNYNITTFEIIDIIPNMKEKRWEVVYINQSTGDLCQLEMKIHNNFKL